MADSLRTDKCISNPSKLPPYLSALQPEPEIVDGFREGLVIVHLLFGLQAMHGEHTMSCDILEAHVQFRCCHLRVVQQVSRL